MKISRWRLRGVIGALSLIVVGGFLGMLTDRFVLAEVRRVEPVTVGEHEAISEHHAASTAFRRVLQLDDGQAAAIHEILLRARGGPERARGNPCAIEPAATGALRGMARSAREVPAKRGPAPALGPLAHGVHR